MSDQPSPTVYEFVTPSDPYTFTAETDKVAILACLILGNGKAGLTREGNDSLCPFFFFGGVEEWCQEEWGQTFEEAFDENKAAIADALDSIVIGDRGAYELIERHVPPEGRAAFWSDWQEKHRSSLNNFGTYAKKLAESIRKAAAEAAAEAGAKEHEHATPTSEDDER